MTAQMARRAAGAVICAALLAASPAGAKPLIDSSEESYGSVCIDYADTPERLVEICTRALEAVGATPAQRAEMREALGYAHYDLMQLTEAEAVFARMRAQDAGDPRAHLGLAWVAHEREDFAAARDRFETAGRLGVSAQAVAGLADSLWALREIGPDEAVLQFRAALAIQPDYEWAERRIGWIYMEAGAHDKARAHFEGVVAARPHDLNARAGLMEALFELDRYEEALAQANRAIEDDPESYWFLSQRANILFFLDRHAQAIRDADRLIGMEPTISEGYVRRARSMAHLGQRADALDLLEQAEEQTGPSVFLIYWRASLLLDDGQLGAARREIRRNTSRDSADTHDFQLLGQIELEREAYDAAQAAIDRAKALDREDGYTHYYDAVLALRREAGVDDALARFDTAMDMGLPHDWIGDFAGELFRAGYVAHAIAIRAKYPD